MANTSTANAPTVTVPLMAHEDRSGHCPVCLTGVKGPIGQWATCDHCSGTPLDELMNSLLSDLPALDETDRGAVVDTLLPLLALLASRSVTP